MRRSKEIIVLLALLIGSMGFVLWYVIDRRARMHATPPVVVRPAEPVDLTKYDGQTIDFSSGQPVVKDSAEDKAALEAGAKELADATKDVTFEAPKKTVEPVKP